MLPDRVSNPGPLTYESGALPIALHGPAIMIQVKYNEMNNHLCTTIHRYPIFSTRYSVMCKVYTGYCGTSETEHGLCALTVDNPLAKARGLSLRTGAQTMLYLSQVFISRGC